MIIQVEGGKTSIPAMSSKIQKLLGKARSVHDTNWNRHIFW